MFENVLCENGFTFVWLNQGVGCVKSFLASFKQHVLDCRWQDWDSHIQNSDRFSLYRLLKTNHLTEPYMTMNINKFVRCVLTKFRFGVSRIAAHDQRYKNDERNLMCPMCKANREDEIHFVFCCPALDDLRSKHIPSKFYNRPSSFRLVLLLSSNNENVIKNVALFLYKAFKRRETIMS